MEDFFKNTTEYILRDIFFNNVHTHRKWMF